MSSVTAVTESLLLTISNDALYELMSLDPGISKGIIQALCKRTQMMSIQVQELKGDLSFCKSEIKQLHALNIPMIQETLKGLQMI